MSFESRNPTTGEAIAQYPEHTAAEVEACLREGVQELSLSGMRFLAARTTAPSTGTLRELYGSLVPLGVATPVNETVVGIIRARERRLLASGAGD